MSAKDKFKRWKSRRPSEFQECELAKATDKFEYAEIEARFAFEAGYRAGYRDAQYNKKEVKP